MFGFKIIYILGFGCSSAEHAMTKSASYTEDGGDYSENYDSDSSAVPAEEDHDDGLGSEQETDFLSLRPATTNVYVFVANPNRNTVTRIDVETLGVTTAEVGVEPTFVLTSSDYSKAVTFDKGSNTISIIDAETMDVVPVNVRTNLNQMKMSPDGKWVICYHDISAPGGVQTSGGAITYNAISIVNLENATVYDAIAGSHPHDVQFTNDSNMAVVISDDYLAAIHLNQDNLNPIRIPIANDLINPPKAEEVLLDPEGNYALVRQYGVNRLVLVNFNLSSDERVSMVDVGSNPTDMDVSSDQSEAIVICRGSKEIWVYSLADPTADPQVIPFGEISINDIDESMPAFGSLVLSPNSARAVLYSTQIDEPALGVWDRDEDIVEVFGVVKPVSNIGLSPTGETAIVFHPQHNGNINNDSPYYNRHALSLMNLEDNFISAYKLNSAPSAFDSTPDGSTGFYIMENEPYLEVLDYDSFVPTEIPLPSVPIHLGTLPDTDIAYISQDHDLGRISFYDSQNKMFETITGFELNSAIEHE